MQAIDQYLDLYRSAGAELRNHAPEAMNKLRDEAYDLLASGSLKLPVRGDEGYAKTDVEAMFAPDYGLNITRLPRGVDVAASLRCDVPNVSTLMAVVACDTFIPTATLINNLPAGVEVMSLAKAATVHKDIVEKYLGSVAANRTAATALNTLLAQDGVFIHLAPGVALNKPIQIINIFNAAAPVMAVRRVLIVAERGSSAKILMCDHSQSQQIDYLDSQVVEMVLDDGASIEYCDIEESSERTSRISEVYVRQSRDSSLHANITALVTGTTRNEWYVSVDGDNCNTELSGMAIGTGRRTIDCATHVDHNSSHCHSDQMFKYVLFDDSVGAFEGTIEVKPGTIFNEAYQSNRNLLTSPGARMHSQPQLIIRTDEVKCSHGAATGQLDTNALFYMRQRGIPEAEARMMLIQAFMTDVIDTIRIDGLHDRMRHLIEKRLSGKEVLCGDCMATNNCKKP